METTANGNNFSSMSHDLFELCKNEKEFPYDTHLDDPCWLEVAYSEHAYKQAYVDIEQNYPEFGPDEHEVIYRLDYEPEVVHSAEGEIETKNTNIMNATYTFQQLKKLRKSWNCARFFVAKTESEIIVADSKLITVWKKIEDISDQFHTPVTSCYWTDDLSKLGDIENILFNEYKSPPVGYEFHKNANVALSLLQILESYAYGQNTKPLEYWYINGLANEYRFDEMMQKLVNCEEQGCAYRFDD